jgi:arylsulfatase A-like enzyme
LPYRSTFGGIAYLDKQIGQVRRTLDEFGIAENTIILFTALTASDAKQPLEASASSRFLWPSAKAWRRPPASRWMRVCTFHKSTTQHRDFS